MLREWWRCQPGIIWYIALIPITVERLRASSASFQKVHGSSLAKARVVSYLVMCSMYRFIRRFFQGFLSILCQRRLSMPSFSSRGSKGPGSTRNSRTFGILFIGSISNFSPLVFIGFIYVFVSGVIRWLDVHRVLASPAPVSGFRLSRASRVPITVNMSSFTHIIDWWIFILFPEWSWGFPTCCLDSVPGFCTLDSPGFRRLLLAGCTPSFRWELRLLLIGKCSRIPCPWIRCCI